METKIVSFCNQKGGVGKTTTTALVAYNLAKEGYRVLVIDFDPQSNMTSMMLKTKSHESDDVVTIDNTLMTAIKNNENLNKATIKIMRDLYLLPNAVDFSLYGRFLEANFSNEKDKIQFFSKKINKELRGEYDYIFIDVPPTMSLPNDTVFYACDDIIIILQTQQYALDGAQTLVDYIQHTIIDFFDSDVDVIGVLPVLSAKKSSVDQSILARAKEKWGDNVFEHHIMLMERAKRMGITGITDGKRDAWDKTTHEKYKDVADEMVQKIKENE